MWDRGSSVGGFYTRAPIFITLLATIVASGNATSIGAVREITGDAFPASPAEVPYESSASPLETSRDAVVMLRMPVRIASRPDGALSAQSGDEFRSHVPGCVGPTMTSRLRQQVRSATSPDSAASIAFRRGGVADTGSTDQEEPLVILLRVRDTARVPENVLTKAQGDVTRIFREAGVEVLWPTTESLSSESTVVRRAVLTVAILTMSQAERIEWGGADGRVGFTARTADGKGQLVYVIYDRVQLLTGGNGLRRERMLAIAIAHEIGHLLLPDNGHSHAGLMRAYWNPADLRLVQRELTFFTPGQGKLLRSRLSSSPYRIHGETLQRHLCSGASR